MNAVKTAELRVEDLLDRARQIAGMSDFGDPWFLAPLAQLVAMINREAGLPSIDAFPVGVVANHLVDRLRLTDYLRRHPAIRDEEINVAGVIIAHARGGSTLLQSLLTASPQLTAPRWFEQITPVPLADEKVGDSSMRVQMGRDWIQALQSASPDVKAVHPMDAMAYEEEMLLLNHSFLGFMFSSYFNLPSFNLWMMDQDHSKSYEELKVWLQLLQYQNPGRRGQKWLLKAVHHMMTGNLKTLLGEFPNAKLIMTHRKLENVIGSLCSAQAMLIELSGSTTFDPLVLGPSMVLAYTRALKSMMAVRRSESATRFIDVQYKDLLSDPLGEFAKVMELLNLSPGRADMKAASEWMDRHPRSAFPTHRYQLERFGLTRERLVDTFKFYDDAFIK